MVRKTNVANCIWVIEERFDNGRWRASVANAPLTGMTRKAAWERWPYSARDKHVRARKYVAERS